MNIKKESSFKLLVAGCKGCNLKYHRRKLVIGRGAIPAKLLILGDGPNKSEDLLGIPFHGESGTIIDEMIREASEEIGIDPPSYYLSNIVLCRPWIYDDVPDQGQRRDPTKMEALACMKYVMKIYKKVNPEFVIFAGRVAENYYKKEFTDSIHITHPNVHLLYGGKASPTYLYDLRNLSELFKRLSK